MFLSWLQPFNRFTSLLIPIIYLFFSLHTRPALGPRGPRLPQGPSARPAVCLHIGSPTPHYHYLTQALHNHQKHHHHHHHQHHIPSPDRTRAGWLRTGPPACCCCSASAPPWPRWCSDAWRAPRSARRCARRRQTRARRSCGSRAAAAARRAPGKRATSAGVTRRGAPVWRHISAINH